MARPKTKTSPTSLRVTPEVREVWERCAANERRTLTNMLEVMVLDYARRAGIGPSTAAPQSETSKF